MTWQPPTEQDRPGYQPMPPERMSLRQWFRRHWWIIPVGAVALVPLSIGAFRADEADRLDDRAWDAHRVCAEFTRDRLKSPGSADFPEYDDRGVTIVKLGNSWVVRSFVDSQNGFGAMLRMSFRCEVTPVGDRWRLEEWTEG